ncbi:hypothetical protein F4778DRAFT_681677 [Xylariomycetidae sp. FL2044]|nr:hypothetical protein F4778DRAFT_681677 [Xylariomycetidae sp. FL2044]
MQEVDVLIVGGGPTGMALALELAAQGISYRIINKDAERSPYSRALAVQPRSLELLHRHGDARSLVASGTTAEAAMICVNGRQIATISTVMVMLPLKGGMVRLVVSRPPSGGDKATDDDDENEKPKLEDFEDFMRQVFPGPATLHDPAWITRFHVHHRQVNGYRAGRLFLAGDAAHIHSPADGQGMNTGIQDSVNLGWKLAAVLRGEKPDSFLDSYDEERHKVGARLLRTSDRTFTTVASTNPVFIFFRNLVMPWVVPLVLSYLPGVANKYFETISELRIRYRNSGIVATAAGYDGPRRGGDRAPDGRIKGPGGETKWLHELFSPDCHHLVLFSGVGPSAASEGDLLRAESRFLENRGRTAVKVHTLFNGDHAGETGFVDSDGSLHEQYGFKQAGYALVRPDDYLATIGPLPTVLEAVNWL